jgi:WW domain-binding protein 2
MLHPRHGFVRLPAEEVVLQSPPRTSLSITASQSYPGNKPLSIQSSAGVVYLTNQRVRRPNPAPFPFPH